MNARERARQIKLANGVLWSEDIDAIEQAIIAAEEAKAREVKAECAEIVKKEIERWDRESVVELRESILIEIKARSEGEKKGE